MTAVSFVIPAFNESLLISSCIGSIRQAVAEYERRVEPLTYEIVVVDNNSTDDTAFHATLRGACVAPCETQGITHARQAGMLAAQYGIHAYVDADCRVPCDWLSGNLWRLVDDPDCVVITGPIRLDEQGLLERAAARWFAWMQLASHHLIGASIQGGNYIVRRDALLLAGGHSIEVEFYGEDTDLAIRLSKIGNVKMLSSMWTNTSARRFTGQGYFKTSALYALNYFSMHLLGRAVTKNHKNFRAPP